MDALVLVRPIRIRTETKCVLMVIAGVTTGVRIKTKFGIKDVARDQ